jgi:putative hemolysin
MTVMPHSVTQARPDLIDHLRHAASAGGLALAALGNDDGDNGANIGMPNPASVFCEEQGGTVEIVADEDGNQWGICQLADGTQIDEWEYWRQFHSSGVDMCV